MFSEARAGLENFDPSLPGGCGVKRGPRSILTKVLYKNIVKPRTKTAHGSGMEAEAGIEPAYGALQAPT